MYIKYRGWASDKDNVFCIDIIDTEILLIEKPETVIVNNISLKTSNLKKTDAVHSNSLSFTITSMRDMQFLELYTANQYKYKVHLYKNDILIWSGHIDSEVYEESYNYSSRYPVTITASDFGILKRNKYSLKGIVSVFNIIKNAVEVAKMDFNNIYIANTISISGVVGRCLENIFINLLNFEDKTIHEAIDGILKSFSLRILYISGSIYITDFNALCSEKHTYNRYNNLFSYVGQEEISHNLGSIKLVKADAVLSVQPIYQTAQITYKINPEESLLKISSGSDWKGLIRQEIIVVPDTKEDGFVISTYDSSGETNMEISYPLTWVKTTPYLSDANISGARSFEYSQSIGGVIIKSKNTRFITPSSRYRLRVKMNVLLSVSNNPFEGVSLANHKGNNKDMNNHSNIIWFYADLYLKNSSGEVIYFYASKEYDHTVAGWVKVKSNVQTRNYILAYYNENRKNESPAGRVMTNGIFISNNNRAALSSFAKNNIGNGDIVPMPPVAGYLEIVVYRGFKCFDYQCAIKQNYNDFKWLIYGGITVNVEDISTGKALPNDDIVYQCRINDYAKDEYKETMVVGSNIDENPLSKSSIYKMIDGDYHIATSFKKDGIEKTLEDFRIISLFSNFSNKLLELNSTIMVKSGFGYIVENGKKMFKISSDYDVVNGFEKATFIEICPDNFNVKHE